MLIKPRANGRNIVGQQPPTLLAGLHTLLHIAACCYVSLGVIARSLKPVKLLATCKPTLQFPTLLAHHCSELLRPFARSMKSTKKSLLKSRSKYLFIYIKYE